jgi:hypothetical protein
MKVALDLITEKTIEKYADIECVEFGDILLMAMGIDGGCTCFGKSKAYDDLYYIGWVRDNGEMYDAKFDMETMKRSLSNKSMAMSMDVYTRD